MSLKVSIILPVLNAVKTIRQSICSVLAQNYSNIELIVIDGGSTDGTQTIIQRYSDNIAYWHSFPDKNAAAAFNQGLKKASGEIIGFLNADDWLEKDALIQIIQAMRDPKIDFCYGPIHLYSGDRILSKVEPLHQDSWKNEMFYQLPVPHIGTYIRSTVLKKVGFFNEAYNFSDYEYFIRMVKADLKGIPIKNVVANARIGGRAHSMHALIEKWKIAAKHKIPFWARLIRFTKYFFILVLTLIFYHLKQDKILFKLFEKFKSRHSVSLRDKTRSPDKE